MREGVRPSRTASEEDHRMSALFTPLTLRGVTLPNRVALAPMCQYSAGPDGLPTDWHRIHLGSRAVGGAGLVLTEATAVLPEGRISPQDTGLWSGAHVEAWRPITAFVSAQGGIPAVQLAHAGFKASTYRPWAGHRGGVPDTDGGWTPVGPGGDPFLPDHRRPTPLGRDAGRVSRPGGTSGVRGRARGPARPRCRRPGPPRGPRGPVRPAWRSNPPRSRRAPAGRPRAPARW